MTLSSVTAEHRTRVVRALFETEATGDETHVDITTFKDIEKAIHKKASTHEEYTALVVRMLFVLSHNRKEIIRLLLQASPEAVLDMKDVELLLGTGVARAQEQLDDSESRFKSMLQEKFEELTDKGHDGSEGLLKCTRCLSTNVIWDQRQTRSADEGMTIIAKCLHCNNAWSMS
jgi:DNA-directed RNA polymerase subunit M/transcription elongation factor TFIIS